MKTVIRFVRHHWLTLGLLLGSLYLVMWIVETQRTPGAMTIIEAQAMDMTAMKAPPGVHPVAAEHPVTMSVSSESSFPAEVLAFSDESVAVRIPGRIKRTLVYPGDRVVPGQLLAEIEADEFAAMSGESTWMARAGSSMALAVQREVESMRAALTRSRAGLSASGATVERARAGARSAQTRHSQAKRELEAAEQAILDARASLKYSEAEVGRARRLHEAGAISLDERQMAEREFESSVAKTRAAQAEREAKFEATRSMEAEVEAAQAAVKEASEAQHIAKAEVDEAASRLKKTEQEARAKEAEREALKSTAASASTLSQYRFLRALSHGVVSERTASPGAVVMPGEPVFQIRAIDTVRVQSELPQALASQVRAGTRVLITTGSTTREATVSSVFPVVSADSRTFRVEALVPNKDHSLLPGMYATLSLLGGPEDGLSVRNSAIQYDADGNAFVWVMGEAESSGEATDWTCTMHPEVSEPGPGICPKCKMDLVPRKGTGDHVAEARKVQLGAQGRTHTAIASGLAETDQVIWAGIPGLFPGAPVRAMEWGENGPKELPAAAGMPEGHDHSAGEASKVSVDDVPEGVYYCPMHPDVQSADPGTCPKCKMDLVQKGGE